MLSRGKFRHISCVLVNIKQLRSLYVVAGVHSDALPGRCLDLLESMYSARR